MIDDSNRNYKPRWVRVKLSTPFLVRTKCKACGGSPKIYYYTRNATLWYDARRVVTRFDSLKHLIKRAVGDHYYWDDPKYFTKLSTFTHGISYTSYRPRLHRTRGSNPIFDTVEYLSCECGATRWAFSERASAHRPEITNRKARGRFPHKFED
jgi:hypothetical protein